MSHKIKERIGITDTLFYFAFFSGIDLDYAFARFS